MRACVLMVCPAVHCRPDCLAIMMVVALPAPLSKKMGCCSYNVWSYTLLNWQSSVWKLHKSNGTNFSPGSRASICTSPLPSSGTINTVVMSPQTTLRHHAHGTSQNATMVLQVYWIWPARQSHMCTAHRLLTQSPILQVGSMAGQPQRGNSPVGPPMGPASV